VKSSAAQAASEVLDNVKARIAANPVAALAVGAGIAWRLYRHPPIASLLVGTGIAALLRTDPQQPALGAQGLRRARRTIRATTSDLQESAAARHLRDGASRVGATLEGVVPAVQQAGQKAGDLASTSAHTVAEVASTAAQSATDLASAAADSARNLASTAAGSTRELVNTAAPRMKRSIRKMNHALRHGDAGDKVLLGAAALAVAAAAGLALRRRDR
jgi:hypothetical protein